MHTPKAFAVTDAEEQHRLIRAHPFATLVSQGPDGPRATHLPLLLHTPANGGIVLRGHMARVNPQLQDWKTPVLAIFTGPHGYISPRWYAQRGDVPTWNYAAVHVLGRMRVIEDAVETDGILYDMIARFEPAPLRDIPPEKWDRLRRDIRAFEITAEKVEAKAKLSQNRSAEDIRGVINGLMARGEAESSALADLMEAALDGER